MSSEIDLEYLRQWVGRTQESTDTVTAHLVQALRSTLFISSTKPMDGDEAPLTTHWCLAPPVADLSALGEDGHPMSGGILPPIPLPRRMWAGGQLKFHGPLRVGDCVNRTSRVADVQLKRGTTGLLCFVSVDHTIATRRGCAVEERQEIVYRQPAPVTNAGSELPNSQPSEKPAEFARELTSSPILLFRYSALTFNGHRIHYDRDYATGVEGYKDLVVHGPLQAALLSEYVASLRGSSPKSFSYKSLRPLFGRGLFSLNADELENGFSVWTADSAGLPAMKAVATW